MGKGENTAALSPILHPGLVCVAKTNSVSWLMGLPPLTFPVRTPVVFQICRHLQLRGQRQIYTGFPFR